MAAPARRAVITGVGLITPLGNDRASVAASLRAGRHGLAPAVFFGNPDLPVKAAGTVKDFAVDALRWRDWSWPKDYEFPRETLRGLAPHGVYALCAVTQALRDARLAPADIAGDDATGLFCASAGSARLLHHHVAQLHAVRGERGNPMGVVSSIAGTLNFNLAAQFHVTGAVCGFVSACASASHALGCATDEIRLGRLRRVVVVGAEELILEEAGAAARRDAAAHATSTPVGDRAEALALRAVFTDRGARARVSSTKALTGHPLSLAGVMEAAFCVLALTEGFLPGNPHLVTPDPACAGLDLPRAAVAERPRVVLNNSSGFGGSNVCHVLRTPTR